MGSSAAALVRAVGSVTPDPLHYRTFEALERLAALRAVTPLIWVAAGAACAGLAWHALTTAYRLQERVAGWRAAVGLAFPVVIGVVLLALGEPSTRAGRFVAVAAAGMAGPGVVMAWSILVLWPVWASRPWCAGPRFVWSLSMGVMVVLGLWMAAVQEPTGDEPSYLLAMHSLAYDHDLDVGNNHARQDYRHFYPGEITHGQILPTRRGIVLPKHSLGLPVVGATVYRFGGRTGVSILCSAIAAAYAGCIYHLVRRRKGVAAASRCWSVSLLCAPLVLYAGQIYPNAAVGLLVVTAMLLSPARPVAAGVPLGLVPWLHLGSWPLAGGVLVVLIARDAGRTGRYLIGPAALWGILAAMHWYFWRALLPPAGVYGRFAVSAVPGALLGLALDQEAGILWIAPVWMVAAAGLCRRTAGSLVEPMMVGAWLVYVSTFNWWFGGWSPTGRFLLPAVGLAAVVLADGIAARRTLARGLWLLSCLISCVLIAFPFFRFNAHDGTNSVLDASGPPGRFLALLLPSVVAVRPAVWAFWGAATVMGAFAVCRRAQQSA